MSITTSSICKLCNEQITKGSKSGLCSRCSHLGHKGYWTGKTRSNSTKQKIRETKLGCTGYWKNKKRENISGENHWTTRQNFTLEHRKKLVLSHVGQNLDIHKKNCQCSFCKAKRGEYKGENNPFFGKGLFGELNPNWRDGASFELYGTEFDSNLKEQVRFRDKYKCKVCDCPQIENGKQLGIHHIDYNKKNNKLNNLVALCVHCHGKTNFNREYWTKYFKEKILCQ